ncbi:hypothetical protein AGIG_G17301 [Arapaima gigas]
MSKVFSLTTSRQSEWPSSAGAAGGEDPACVAAGPPCSAGFVEASPSPVTLLRGTGWTGLFLPVGCPDLQQSKHLRGCATRRWVTPAPPSSFVRSLIKDPHPDLLDTTGTAFDPGERSSHLSEETGLWWGTRPGSKSLDRHSDDSSQKR